MKIFALTGNLPYFHQQKAVEPECPIPGFEKVFLVEDFSKKFREKLFLPLTLRKKNLETSQLGTSIFKGKEGGNKEFIKELVKRIADL